MPRNRLPLIETHARFKQNGLVVTAFVVKILFTLRNRTVRTPPARRTRIVITKSNHVLLVKNIPYIATWSLPGGGYEAGETAEQCCQRELLQELRIATNPADYMFIGTFTEQVGAVHITHDCYHLAYRSNESLRINSELIDAQWFNMSTLPINKTSWLSDILQKIEKI